MLAVPQWARDSEGGWVGITVRARVIVYNSELDEFELPMSVEELTGPKWNGRVGWAPANASFRVMVTAMRHLWGENKTRDWLAGMMANDVREYPKNTPIVDAVGKGEVDLGLVNHYYLHRFIAEYGDDFGARNLFLNDGGPGSLVIVTGTGILKTSPNSRNAELFLRFLLSQVAQQYLAASVYEYPLIEGVKTHRLIPPIDSLNGPEIDFFIARRPRRHRGAPERSRRDSIRTEARGQDYRSVTNPSPLKPGAVWRPTAPADAAHGVRAACRRGDGVTSRLPGY